jgi:hypothetical protein
MPVALSDATVAALVCRNRRRDRNLRFMIDAREGRFPSDILSHFFRKSLPQVRPLPRLLPC